MKKKNLKNISLKGFLARKGRLRKIMLNKE